MSVVMLDQTDGTLHLPLSIAAKDIAEWGELRTACGLVLEMVQVGPRAMIWPRASRRCPECFEEGAA